MKANSAARISQPFYGHIGTNSYTRMHWKRTRSIAVSVVKVTVAFCGLIVTGAIVKAALQPMLRNALPSDASGLIDLLGYSLVLIAMVLATRSSKTIGLKFPESWGGVSGLAVLVAYVAGFVTATHGGVDRSISSIGLQLLLYTSLAAILTGFWEELFFRGYALRILAPCGVVGSLVMCSLLFSVVHIRPSKDTLTLVSNLLPSFSMGLLFAVNRMQTGSILPVICAHGAFDLYHFLFFGDSSKASESETDPVSFMLSILLSLPILAYCFLVIRKNRKPWLDRYGSGNTVEQGDELGAADNAGN